MAASPAASSILYNWLYVVAAPASVGLSWANSGMIPTLGTFTTRKCLASSLESVLTAANCASTPAVTAADPVPCSAALRTSLPPIMMT